jgi:NAD(P)-dependent dehydrogenase (short-subunit alcohol dehydrogenase family)
MDGISRMFSLDGSLRVVRLTGSTLLRDRLQVNVLSPHLLAILLLPIMVRTAETYKTRPRLVVVSSGAHVSAPVPFDALENGGKGFHRAISESKWNG